MLGIADQAWHNIQPPYVRIILVQVCFNCFFYEDEAEEIPDSAY